MCVRVYNIALSMSIKGHLLKVLELIRWLAITVCMLLLLLVDIFREELGR